MDIDFYYSHPIDSNGRINEDELNLFNYRFATPGLKKIVNHGLETKSISEEDCDVILTYVNTFDRKDFLDIPEFNRPRFLINLNKKDNFICEISKVSNEEYKWSIDKSPMSALSY